jgi:hypothetical protein
MGMGGETRLGVCCGVGCGAVGMGFVES